MSEKKDLHHFPILRDNDCFASLRDRIKCELYKKFEYNQEKRKLVGDELRKLTIEDIYGSRTKYWWLKR